MCNLETRDTRSRQKEISRSLQLHNSASGGLSRPYSTTTTKAQNIDLSHPPPGLYVDN